MSEYQPQINPWFVAHKRFSTVGVALCVMLAFWVGLNIVCGGIVVSLFPSGDYPAWVSLLASSGPLYAVAMPLAVLAMGNVPALETKRFNLGAKRFFTLLVICLPVIYLGNIIGTVLSDLIFGGQSTNRVAEVILDSDPVSVFVFYVVLAPICEEWLFRKQIIDRTRRYGEKTAILLSALTFALFHLNLYQFFYAFGLGLVFGYVYMRTSRVRYSMIMHAVVNFNGSILGPWVLSQVDSRLLTGELSEADMMRVAADPSSGLLIVGLYGLALFALLIVGVALMVTNRRKLEFYTTPEQLPDGLGARTAFGNPGMVVYILFALVLTVWQMALV
ncbi:CPBP family intramembrane glutamic endopeptidase [Bifidobacterium lemurum]|nr:type II CAAX endopeptidase family protein [Bifidobacterium lemurum]